MTDSPQQQNPSGHRSPLGQAAEEQGTVLTQMLIVADIERSVRFYRDVLGAMFVRDNAPAMLASTTAGS
ncbi:MAG: VOC family protein [Solirubrobacterales bacterium]|nr:VOC family protein [Solirubrobacterales bacterium]MBV8943282.1 VOC family protein [Solirubrobacterales bacterium]MBV9165956.1 VOC family protein [Solirubrobacterales bacterium]MBV9534670.1 VOC family protein [Solirubrobacterales bacterium]